MANFDWAGFYSILDGIRESRALQWKDVADQSGIAASTLSRLRNGKTCDVDSLAGLRQWAGISIDRFFTNGSK